MIIQGNLIDLAEKGMFDVIVHGCNCFHTMGAGIAKEISSRYPQALEADKTLTKKGDKNKIGRFTYVNVCAPSGYHFVIVNAYTQYNYGRPKKGTGPLVNYDAIATVFKLIARDFPLKIIGYPKIGAGLAGGDWTIIEGIINRQLSGMQHNLVIL